jgi:hypothetical protein
MHDRIDDAIDALNVTLGQFGVTMVEVSGDYAALADIHIQVASTSEIGGEAEGVLGVTLGSEITLINTWSFYVGADASLIGSDQFDFQTVATHELGHALGLGHSTDATSVMYPYLATGDVRRDLSVADVSVVQQVEDAGAEALMAAPGVRAVRGLELTAADIAAPAAAMQVATEASQLPTVASQISWFDPFLTQGKPSTSALHRQDFAGGACGGEADWNAVLQVQDADWLATVNDRGSLLRTVATERTTGSAVDSVFATAGVQGTSPARAMSDRFAAAEEVVLHWNDDESDSSAASENGASDEEAQASPFLLAQLAIPACGLLALNEKATKESRKSNRKKGLGRNMPV